MRYFFLFYTHYYKAGFKWKKPVDARRVNLPAVLTLARVYMKKKLSLCLRQTHSRTL